MRKLILKALFLIIFLWATNPLYSASFLAESPENQIQLGTFNIEKLGGNNPYQAQNAAEILMNYDIVAVQEVMNFGATKDNPIGGGGIEALKRIVSHLGDDWSYVVSSEPNGTLDSEKSRKYSMFEYYAFLYRKSKIELVKDSAYLWNESGNPIAGLKEQERQFDREPFIASFKARNGKLDFTIITIHAAAPDRPWRKDEIKRLAIAYKTVQDSDASQNDVFLMGDFNTNADRKEWDDLKSLPEMKHVLASDNPTTLYKAGGRLSKSQYDTIWHQGSYSDEDIIAETAQVHQAWKENLHVPSGVEAPKKMKDENKQIWLYGEYASDHLPVTVLLWADKDSDNFKTEGYNEKQLNAELKGRGREDVLKALGEPAVRKPCKECSESLEYWWYNFSEANIFVHFRDEKVVYVGVIKEDERGGEI